MTIRVLHCIHSLHGGGAERQLNILLDKQNDHGLEMSVFCINDSLNTIKNDRCKIYTIKDRRKYPYKLVGEITKVIDALHPHILHAWLPPSISVPSLMAAKIKKIKTVASYRNKKMFDSWIRIPEYISNMLLADSIITNNPIEQSDFLFRKQYYGKNGVFIPNAVDIPEKYRKIHGERNKSIFTFLFVGRLTYQKNIEILLQALETLKYLDNWELKICGKGEYEIKIRKLIGALGLEKRVIMLGYKKNIYEIMQSSDLLVLPSWYEGMPNVVFEAMEIGLICLVSNVESHRVVFGSDAGIIYFDPKNKLELANALSTLLTSRDGLIENIDKQRKYVENYSVPLLLDRYKEFYMKLVGIGDTK